MGQWHARLAVFRRPKGFVELSRRCRRCILHAVLSYNKTTTGAQDHDSEDTKTPRHHTRPDRHRPPTWGQTAIVSSRRHWCYQRAQALSFLCVQCSPSVKRPSQGGNEGRAQTRERERPRHPTLQHQTGLWVRGRRTRNADEQQNGRSLAHQSFQHRGPRRPN
jgi:hypothetical protein